VDSGIGGAVAEAMGRSLADVARGRQVLCITHLPQVAAFGERHFRVEKRIAAGRTHSAVTLLEREAERRQEIARMLAGHVVTASALEHATALIEAARDPLTRSASSPPAAAATLSGNSAAPDAPEAPRTRGAREGPSRAAARRVSA
jgi:DNA repair protein RecN (Recombination protein N)